MDTLLKAISQYSNGTHLMIEWENGCTVVGNIDTIYETNNELEPDDKAYQEFHVCLLYVTDVLDHPDEKKTFSKGELLEISIQDSPMTVRLEDGTTIWTKR